MDLLSLAFMPPIPDEVFFRIAAIRTQFSRFDLFERLGEELRLNVNIAFIVKFAKGKLKLKTICLACFCLVGLEGRIGKKKGLIRPGDWRTGNLPPSDTHSGIPGFPSVFYSRAGVL